VSYFTLPPLEKSYSSYLKYLVQAKNCLRSCARNNCFAQIFKN